jgi:hypothetical protein
VNVREGIGSLTGADKICQSLAEEEDRLKGVGNYVSERPGCMAI